MRLRGRRRAKKILVAIFQRGAADGLNVVVPHGEKAYYDLRPTISVPRPSPGNADAAIDLDGFFGLHPALGPLKPLFDQRHLAIVDAVGSPDPTRSHFDAQDYMESGTPGFKATASGWMNRALPPAPASGTGKVSPVRAIALGAPRRCRAPCEGGQPAVALAEHRRLPRAGSPRRRNSSKRCTRGRKTRRWRPPAVRHSKPCAMLAEHPAAALYARRRSGISTRPVWRQPAADRSIDQSGRGRGDGVCGYRRLGPPRE